MTQVIVRPIETVFNLFMWLYDIKCLTLMLMLLIFFYGHPGDSSGDAKCWPQTSCYQIMLGMGFLARGLGSNAWLIYILFASLGCTHFAISYYWRDNINRINSTGLVAFLRDRERENGLVARRLNAQLGRLFASNMESQRLLAERGIDESKRALAKLRMIHGSSLHVDSTDDGAANEEILSVEDEHDLETDGDSGKDFMAQLRYIEYLMRNQAAIKPVNRTWSWHKTLVGLWMVGNIYVMVSVWLIGNIIAYMLFLFFLNLINRNNDQLNSMDMLDVAGFQLMAVFIMDWFSSPMSLMVAGYFDQYKYLIDVVQRFTSLNKKLNQLREHYMKEVCSNHCKQNKNSTNDRRREIARRRTNFLELHRTSCDREAIELYVVFSFFVQESRVFFLQSEFFIVTAYSSAWLLVVTMIAFASTLPFQTVRYYYIMIAISVLLLDFAMLPTALLTSQCIKVSQMSWSLLANCEKFTKDEYKLRNENYETCFLASGIVSSHTLQLWHRLTRDQEALCNTVSGKFLGLFRLDFKTILQLNLVLVSLVVLLFSATGT